MKNCYQESVELEVDSCDESVEVQCSKVSRIANLDRCRKLKKLALISNRIIKIENLTHNLLLEHLDLYQNKIEVIENLGHLTKLRILDLSFNEITEIKGLEGLEMLEELYLSSNKITEIKGLDNCLNLTALELGNNKIRKIEGLDKLLKLKSLWLGKNKITSMKLPHLPCLERLSLQNNRLKEWDMGITKLTNLCELYLSHNMLSNPPNLSQMALKIVDLGNNEITRLDELAKIDLVELWLNNNFIDNIEPLNDMKKLQVLYLEGNPVQHRLGPSYRNQILQCCTTISQLDANIISDRVAQSL
ncbi:Leucine Rich repeats (2 copies) [Babesia microti strain RI]|uniref:Leucine Rich repeats (2 copies) n=1 Tax=Babesia microti (strain RI) TaxID=1133968 RepID=A0A1N6LY40_BABMR|nr:Leucine Rich repeats (2 copies) [Babesia microti strain RI]SIO73800.1 Leucine Rich repeats (2 copies) [Babesia microti strain RI]|eukprot:XP_021337859.1 Leucine Rich repeats (2 copies) [Babesia microti strain RI]